MHHSFWYSRSLSQHIEACIINFHTHIHVFEYERHLYIRMMKSETAWKNSNLRNLKNSLNLGI